jgi:3-oxoadipate enol-lactonase
MGSERRWRFVTVGEGDLYVDDHGSGPPVLLVPGLGYAAWCWRAQQPLGRDWRLLAVEPRGSGRSFKPAGPYSISAMAADLAAVVRAVGGAPVHVVGLSMGGYLALTLALDHVGLVRSLVLLATSAGGEGHVPVPESTRSAWLQAADLPPERYARATMPLSFAPGWVQAHRDEYERWLSARLEHPTPPQSWAAQFAACEAYLRDGIPAEHVDVPALVLHGDHDRVVPEENGRVLAERLPRARLLSVAGAGHLLHMEQPRLVNAAVTGFLHGVEAGAAG